MFCIGTVYALSTLQTQLLRLFGISDVWSFAPFGVAFLGLSIGVLTSASTILQSGAHVTVIRGTILWGTAVIGAGLSLSRLKFGLMIICFLFGGIGIGWTYLAVVVLIDQGLPRHALARSAIGPLGFSTAAATCFLLSSVIGLEVADAKSLGRMLVLLGVTFTAVGAFTQVLLPNFSNSAVSPPSVSSTSPSEFFFSILLFFNALPGMTLFAGLLPLASQHMNGTDCDKMWILSYCMAALAFGGVLAPCVCAYCGARLTFVIILCLRGVLLVLHSRSEGSTLAMCAILAVLFAHGTGFSLIPGLIKNQSSNQQLFFFGYGRVLASWGTSGIAGCIVSLIIRSPVGAVPTGELVVGLLSFSFGTILYFVPSLGGEFLT
jgi:hypothetical protein